MRIKLSLSRKGCKVVMYLNVPINHSPFIPMDVRLIAIGIYRHHTVNLFVDTTDHRTSYPGSFWTWPISRRRRAISPRNILGSVRLAVRPTTDPSIPQQHWVTVTARIVTDNEVCNSGVRANNKSDKKPYYVNQKTVVAFRLFSSSSLTTRPHQEQESIE